ncbi:plasmid pRiA4b ORF-3 family protein [Thiomonas sp. FB-Cd]|uniref:plasmid pRiA4b ORF-3 family protein n=1 Tax=Thiomonas sp. FB-Cd TaxID=1158292 RepID=UPI0004DF0EFD|nr:plasmid pRiA4b ORF-3 family protein [Thiomonas sp. FB-Cd]
MATTKSPPRRKTIKNVYQLHVQLLYVEPRVWRRLWVPDNLTLTDLDQVIQTAMGWTNSHLHEFEIDGQRYGMSLDEYPIDKPAKLDKDYRLSEVLSQHVKTFIYTYDFGDDWRHAVTVEQTLKPDPALNTWPQCLEGENACPPEDVGGVPGYMEFLEAVGDSTHEEHKAMRRWFGGLFDPKGFDINAVNIALRDVEI